MLIDDIMLLLAKYRRVTFERAVNGGYRTTLGVPGCMVSGEAFTIDGSVNKAVIKSEAEMAVWDVEEECD